MRITTILTLLCFYLQPMSAPAKELEGFDSISVCFIDVGQGDCILIRSETKNVLIDAGERRAAGKVHNFLQSENVDTLHIVIATHPHADHIGGLISILNTVPVLELIDPGLSHTTVTYKDYLQVIERNEISVTKGRAEMVRQLGETSELNILHPVTPTRDLNNSAIVLRLINGENSFLFTADIEKKAEQEIMSRYENLGSTVLKVAKHGSRESTSKEFLRAVNPDIAVIMCGDGNIYGHPHEEVLDRLEDEAVTIYRTDLDGTICFTCDGESITRIDIN
ncbi:Late competence protein ComEC, DNA transport [Chitinispirillum alkaliphilum]|nr:Late competence protein ComEC, DNA transport [Chitinispirillum alkaliphilum]